MENKEIMLVGFDVVEFVKGLCNQFLGDSPDMTDGEKKAYRLGIDSVIRLLDQTLNEMLVDRNSDYKDVVVHVPGLKEMEEFATVEEAFDNNVKYFEENGFEATVTSDKVRWEIPIDNLANAFNYSPENPSEDGEKFVEIKEDKTHEFAEFVAKTMMQPYNQETGASYIEEALDKVFNEVFEGYEDFADYPEYDDDCEE